MYSIQQGNSIPKKVKTSKNDINNNFQKCCLAMTKYVRISFKKK